jgi:alpha-D-ribose 1-methylphosphonate 5-triphosphate diphosphatase PhnM
VPSKTLGFSMLAKPVLVKGLSHFWIVGNLAKLMSNLIQEIESNSIPESIFMTIFDLAEYSNM